MNSEVFPLIQIEIDLMRAAGFTLVLCANYRYFYRSFIFDLIQRNQFSEVHINANQIDEIEDFAQFEEKEPFDLFRGFLYIYCPFIFDNNDSITLLKKLGKKPRISVNCFSNDIENSLKLPIVHSIKPFAYCKTGFKYKYLRVTWVKTKLIQKNEFFSLNSKSRKLISKSHKKKIMIILCTTRRSCFEFFLFQDFVRFSR